MQARIREAINAAPTPTRRLVFDAEALSAIDASGVEALEQTIERLRLADITFVIARRKGPLSEQFATTGLEAAIGTDHFHPNVEAAVRACSDAAS